MDTITQEKRSSIMRAIKNKDTKIEVILRKTLWHQGIRYRKNYKICNCRPDIVITKYKIAIFCDGDFWHGNELNRMPHTNERYWYNKIQRNIERDMENTIDLRDNGWTVLRFWGSEIKNNFHECINIITSTLAHKKQV